MSKIALAPGMTIGPLTLRHYLAHSKVWLAEVDGLDFLIRLDGDRVQQLLRESA